MKPIRQVAIFDFSKATLREPVELKPVDGFVDRGAITHPGANNIQIASVGTAHLTAPSQFVAIYARDGYELEDPKDFRGWRPKAEQAFRGKLVASSPAEGPATCLVIDLQELEIGQSVIIGGFVPRAEPTEEPSIAETSDSELAVLEQQDTLVPQPNFAIHITRRAKGFSVKFDRRL